MGTIYGNEYKDFLTGSFSERMLQDFLKIITQSIQIVPLNISMWRISTPWEVENRQIDDTMLWIVYDGKFQCTVADKTTVLSSGSGFIAIEGIPHAIQFAENCCDGSAVIIHLQLHSYFGRIPTYLLKTPFFNLQYPQASFASLLRLIALRYVNKKEALDYLVYEIQEMFMDWLENGIWNFSELREYDLRICKAIEYIYRNLTANISVADIAESIGLHEIRFREIFLNQTGMTPHAFLVKARLQKVAELLNKTILPLSEIAASSGFNSESYLCRVFHNYYHYSPQSYRKLNNPR